SLPSILFQHDGRFHLCRPLAFFLLDTLFVAGGASRPLTLGPCLLRQGSTVLLHTVVRRQILKSCRWFSGTRVTVESNLPWNSSSPVKRCPRWPGTASSIRERTRSHVPNAWECGRARSALSMNDDRSPWASMPKASNAAVRIPKPIRPRCRRHMDKDHGCSGLACTASIPKKLSS